MVLMVMMVMMTMMMRMVGDVSNEDVNVDNTNDPILTAWKVQIPIVMVITMTNIMTMMEIVKLRIIALTTMITKKNALPEKCVLNKIILKIIH